MAGFGSRLADAVSERGPLCLGIDPHPELLRAWGLSSDADGLITFCAVCVEAFAGFAVVKPQVAFFEAYGAAGYTVLEWTIGTLKNAGVLVLADAKRGDIGSTMTAYAEAWAGESPLAADAVTASPYLGFGSLQPLLDTAAAHGRGVFVLAATSNPEGAAVQRADTGGRTVAQSIVDAAAAVNRDALPEPGSVGVVVGATAVRSARCERARRAGPGTRCRRPGRATRGAGRARRRTPWPVAAGGIAGGAARRTRRCGVASRRGADA